MLFIVEQSDFDDSARIVARTDQNETGGRALVTAYAEDKLSLGCYTVRDEKPQSWRTLSIKQISKVYTAAAGQDPNALFPDMDSAIAGIVMLLKNKQRLDLMETIPLDWQPSAPPVPSIADISAVPAPVPTIQPLAIEPEPTPEPEDDGHKKPRKGTKAGDCWDYFDAIISDPARKHYSRKEMIAQAIASGLKPAATVQTNYGLWRSHKKATGELEAIEKARADYLQEVVDYKLAGQLVDKTAKALEKAKKNHVSAVDALAAMNDPEEAAA